ncbi:MAG: hypothetical protein GY777_06965 [Candidatus Brocadiaceae bacterium]|nr:hypothetical protein [Candidatus Brocadiaceae bacterium]
MKQKPGYFWSIWKNNPWSRVYFFLLFLFPLPVLILYITIFYRLPCITKATEEIRNPVQIRYEIERETVATSNKEMRIAMNNWDGVRKELPDGYEAVSNLIIDLKRFVSSRGFELEYTLGELKSDIKGATGLSLLPINLKLKVRGIDTNQNESVPVGLGQFVGLLHDIVKSYYGVDLINVDVNGVGEGIRTMEVSINLWVGFGGELQGTNEV